MTLSFDPRSADWLAAESLAERQEREAGWHWAWGPKPVDEAPRQFLWSFVLAQPLEGGLAARLSGVRGDGTVHFLAPQAQDWQTRQGAPEGWQGSAPNAEWEPARTPAYDLEWRPTAPQGSRLLRRAFDLPGLPTAATLTITALGGYEAEINGQRVGDARLAPENSDFRKRLLVQQHDVKDLLRAGPNVLGALVADGFYASEAIGRGRYPFGEAPRRLWARLEVQLPDGNSHVVATDGQWRTAHGPVTFAEIYHGETHDARLEQAGWSTPGFDDSAGTALRTAPAGKPAHPCRDDAAR